MKTYGQFCPLAQAVQLLCERWTLIVIREFIAGSTRFSELQKGVPLMSPTLLSSRLKQLEKAGVIEISGNSRNHIYQLTDAGRELRPIVELMGAWGHRWARSDLRDSDLDAGLLMWDMRRSVDPSVFPARRIVIQFEYPDAPEGAREWWLVAEDSEVDLCWHNHGYDVDLLIRCPLKVMSKIWICELTFNDAVAGRELVVMGDPALAGKLQAWLRASPLSRLGTAKTLPVLDWHE